MPKKQFSVNHNCSSPDFIRPISIPVRWWKKGEKRLSEWWSSQVLLPKIIRWWNKCLGRRFFEKTATVTRQLKRVTNQFENWKKMSEMEICFGRGKIMGSSRSRIETKGCKDTIFLQGMLSIAVGGEHFSLSLSLSLSFSFSLFLSLSLSLFLSHFHFQF